MLRVERLAQVKSTLPTTATRVAAGDGVRTVRVISEGPVLLHSSNTLEDGGTMPATTHYRIPAGMDWPIEIGDKRPFISAESGTAATTLTGLP
jgi:hypothetical protein